VSAAVLLRGLALGWSVAWPPGPVNAEMVRRGLGPGFLSAYLVAIGACSGDFLWALSVSLGAGALAQGPRVRLALGFVSFVLLLFLAFSFLRGALRARRGHAPPRPLDSTHGGYLLGLTLALSSPWNIAFWLAVVGQQDTLTPAASIAFAACVLAGALAWGLVLCFALRLGARFATPAWEVTTQALTGLLMLGFAVRLALRVASGAGF
jgi:threonine/homoserine/homoserine lactone efflux protein